MKIAIVCDELPPRPHGGIGTFTDTYAHGLATAGHDVTVVETGESDGRRSGGTYPVVTVRRSRLRGAAWWRTRMRLRDAVADGGFDVVEVPDFHGLLPGGAGDAPMVVRIHGSATACARSGGPRAGRRVRWCERAVFENAVTIVHPTRHALRAARAALGGGATAPATLIPHPVPRALAAAEGPPDGRPPGRVVLFLGSLWGFRGVRPAAAAMRRVLEARDDVHAVFVGEDARVERRPSSRVVWKETGDALADRVHLTGRVPHAEAVRWLRAADVLLHPGEHEAFGLVLLEAFREGLPVVGSSRGPGAEILRDGATALTAAPDDPDALAAAVLRVLDDGDLRASLTTAAKGEIRERFSVARCVAESVAVYRDVLDHA